MVDTGALYCVLFGALSPLALLVFQDEEARQEENGRIEPVGRADSIDHTPVRSLE